MRECCLLHTHPKPRPLRTCGRRRRRFSVLPSYIHTSQPTPLNFLFCDRPETFLSTYNLVRQTRLDARAFFYKQTRHRPDHLSPEASRAHRNTRASLCSRTKELLLAGAATGLQDADGVILGATEWGLGGIRATHSESAGLIHETLPLA